MPDDFNINEASASFAAQIVGDIYDRSIKKATRSLLVTAPFVETNLKTYAANGIETYGSIRTIVSNVPSRLLDIYQPTVFEAENLIVDEDLFQEDLAQRLRAVIRGHAGAGKSLFLKRQFLRKLRSKD